MLALMAISVEHLGPAGMAQVVKLAHDVQVGVGAVALAEALQLALGCGAESGALARCLRMGPGLSPAVSRYPEPMLKAQRGDATSLALLTRACADLPSTARAGGDQRLGVFGSGGSGWRNNSAAFAYAMRRASCSGRASRSRETEVWDPGHVVSECG